MRDTSIDDNEGITLFISWSFVPVPIIIETAEKGCGKITILHAKNSKNDEDNSLYLVKCMLVLLITPQKLPCYRQLHSQ